MTPPLIFREGRDPQFEKPCCTVLHRSVPNAWHQQIVLLLLFQSKQQKLTTGIRTRFKILTMYPSRVKKKLKLRGFSPQSELYRPSDRGLSAKLVPTLAARGCRVVSATNPHGR
jgi:hypothetical protein